MASALVRYGANPILARAAARGAAMYYRNRKFLVNARRVGNVASFIYRNRAPIRRMFKRKRGYGGRVSNKRARVYASPFGSPRTQAYYDSTGAPSSAPVTPTVVLQRKFLWNAVVRLAKPPSSTDNLGAAEANRIHLKGIKVCFNAENVGTADTNRVILHFALVQEKTDENQGDVIDQNDFFSNPGGGEQGLDRTFNFVNATVATPPDFRYNCNGINRSRWNVITHKKWLMGKDTDNHRHMLMFEKYYKINKDLAYETASSTNVMRPIRMLVWHERHTSNGENLDNTIQFNINTISYFRSKP